MCRQKVYQSGGHCAPKEGITEWSEDGINARFRDMDLGVGNPQVLGIIISALCLAQFLKH